MMLDLWCVGDLFVLNMDNHRAEEIARTFLRQSYSVIGVVKSELVDQTWIVEVLVSSFDRETVKKVKVNNQTGYIMGFE